VGSLIRPDPKKRYADFQLSYAEQMLHGMSGR
jgi:hypothetical protein